MKFIDVENIWTVDLALLSNADRGRIFFERSKQVVAEALADPKLRERAIDGKRFRRSYLVERIGCRPSVTTQNPRIKALLGNTDQRLQRSPAFNVARKRPVCGDQASHLTQLPSTIKGLRRRIEAQEIEITELRRRLGEPSSSLDGR